MRHAWIHNAIGQTVSERSLNILLVIVLRFFIVLFFDIPLLHPLLFFYFHALLFLFNPLFVLFLS
jgi:hypothetical protein